MRNTLCCLLDPLRGCSSCDWRICTYCYVTERVKRGWGSSSIPEFHNREIKGHLCDTFVCREMTNAEFKWAGDIGEPK